jgi:hypothetical protein
MSPKWIGDRPGLPKNRGSQTGFPTAIFAIAAATATLSCLPVGKARAQGDVLFPGSTVQGDILRGEGVKYRGEAVLYLNAAKARSIDADTRMRFDQYVYNSLQEYNRQRILHMAGKAANRNANLADILRRLRENPSESDLTGGDALNVLLGDLSDPRISPSSWRAAKVDLPADTIQKVPFQYASAGGVISMRRLKASASWPVSLRYEALEFYRASYLEAVDTLLTQCRQKKLTPEAVEAVGKAVRDLRAKAAATIAANNRDYQFESRRYLDELERSARMLTRTSFIEDLLGEIGDYRGATVGELLDFMRRYNFHFGPADDPDERQLYVTIYPLLRQQLADLGVGESRGGDPIASGAGGMPGAPPPAAAAEPRRTVDPVIGRWRPDRGTQAVPSIWEFRGDGSLVFERHGKKAFGRWSRQGDRVVARTTSDDVRLAVQKWFTIASSGQGYMDIVMEGTRPYTWRRLDLPLGASP